MPSLTAQELQDRAVLIVGNGPSNAVRPWLEAKEAIARLEGQLPDVLLINYEAIGVEPPPTYAVAVGPEVLREYQEHRVHERTRVISNAPHRIVGPESARRDLGILFSSRNFWHAPKRWPPFASGPLAAWAMSILGYARIYLYGLDGSVGPDNGKGAQRLRQWDVWVTRFLTARHHTPFRKEKRRPTLTRVWPAEAEWRSNRDSLRAVLLRTLVLADQLEEVTP